MKLSTGLREGAVSTMAIIRSLSAQLGRFFNAEDAKKFR